MLGTGISLAGQAQAAPVAKAPVPAQLTSVSCVRPTWCMAVGTTFKGVYPANNLAEIWNGASWRLVATPAGAGLATVSCSATWYCLAFGSVDFLKGIKKAPAFRWNGSKWLKIPAPTKPVSVSCASRTLCVTEHSHQQSVETWNGKLWTNTQLCGGGSEHCTADTVCASASLCMTVGWGKTELYNEDALAHIWDGKQWSNSYVPEDGDAGIDSTLFGVSCTAQMCLAVGSPASYEWDDVTKTWHDVTPGSGVKLSGLDVSCGSTTSCMMGGGAWWNGSTWTNTQFAPAPGTNPWYSWVSCKATMCLAVGATTIAHKERPIAQMWNGTAWNATTAPKAP